MFDPFTLRELIKEHGSTITVTKVTKGTYNVTTGKLDGTEEFNFTVKAYPYNDKKHMLGTDLVTRSWSWFVFSPDTLDVLVTQDLDFFISQTGNYIGVESAGSVVDTQYKLTDQGYTYSVDEVKQIRSNGSTMCYMMLVKR